MTLFLLHALLLSYALTKHLLAEQKNWLVSQIMTLIFLPFHLFPATPFNFRFHSFILIHFIPKINTQLPAFTSNNFESRITSVPFHSIDTMSVFLTYERTNFSLALLNFFFTMKLDRKE